MREQKVAIIIYDVNLHSETYQNLLKNQITNQPVNSLIKIYIKCVDGMTTDRKTPLKNKEQALQELIAISQILESND